MTPAGWVFNIVLIAAMIWTATRSISETRMFKSVVLFIAFGLLVAIAWVRLGAPDIALAEAAIGTGITGALMLDAVGHIKRRTEPYPTRHAGQVPPVLPPVRTAPTGLSLLVAVGSLALAGVLAVAELSIPEEIAALAPSIRSSLGASGVENPVTAVLLNFRGYDTLLEVAVLILAALGVLGLRRSRPAVAGRLAPPPGPVLSAMTKMLSPVMLLTAGYLLWAGAHAPGGAFQAGSVLGAAGVLLALSGYVRPTWVGRGLMRWLLVIGFVTFLAIATGTLIAGYSFLEYPREQAKTLMLTVETVLTLSIAAILVSLFVASAAPFGAEEGGEER